MTTSVTEGTQRQEIESGERFAFGENWARFLKVLDEDRIRQAVDSLKDMLEVGDLKGKTFLDIGSGSGLFSLAARRLGASVFSFDYDPQSVACTTELKNRYFKNDINWEVQSGSVLDADYLSSLGKFDVTYSWGVLHHTGNMWLALNNVSETVAEHGKLFIALYNDQRFASKYWTFVKRTYNKHAWSRPFFVSIHAVHLALPSMLLATLRNRKYPRGMSVWYDLYDWLGGYPFEVSKPEEIFEYFYAKGYLLKKMKTVGGKMGCNEFVFQNNN